MSLIELLFSAAIVGVAAAGIAGLVMLNNMSNQKVVNKVDGLDAARNCLERIGMTVRESQNVGDEFDGSGTFPAMGKNPLYGAGQTPTGGWPIAPWTAPPYTLTNQRLILQIPVSYLNKANDPRDPDYNSKTAQDPLNGFPYKLEPTDATLNPPITEPYPNVDTVVYQVVPDPDKPTQTGMLPEYVLQVAVFPGKNPGLPTRQRVQINPPQTVLKGIVNEADPTTPPKVFRYINKLDPAITYDTVTANASNIGGILVNLEVWRYDKTVKQNDSIVGIQSAFYLRNNAAATP